MKKTLPIYLLFAVLIFSNLNCKKEPESNEIETWGYVVDEVTRKPVEGAKVLFYNSSISTSQSHSTWLMDSTTTDQNGFFKKKWKMLKGNATQMNYSKKGYYYYKGLKMNARGDVGQLPIKPNRNYRLYIKNTHPVRDDDSLYLNIGYTNDLDGYKSLEPRWFIGAYDTMVNVRIVYDRQYWSIEYIYKDDDWHYYNGRPTCPPLDTCDIYIEF